MALEECLNKLPERQREYLTLRYDEDLPLREVAQRFRRTENAVAAVLYRAEIRAGPVHRGQTGGRECPVNSSWGPEFENLLRAVMDGPPESVDWPRLGAILDENPEAVAAYVELMTLDALLRWRSGKKLDAPGQGADLPLPTGPTPPPLAPSPFLLDFLRDAGLKGWGFFSDHTLLFSLFGLLILGALAVVVGGWTLRGHRTAVASREVENGKDDHPADAAFPLARPGSDTMGATNDVVRGDEGPSLPPSAVRAPPGGPLPPSPNSAAPMPAGGMLHVPPFSPASACLPGSRWACWRAWRKSSLTSAPRSSCQGPATFEVESGTSARLSLGKATTQITQEAARGFKIRTPQATFVDQGTEFGVEVSPGGSSRVHVFQGCVDVAMKAAGGKAPPASQRLMENAGARLEGDTPSMTLMEDTGESFIRSMDESGTEPARGGLLAVRGPAAGHAPARHPQEHPQRPGHDRFLLQRQRPVHLLPGTPEPHFSGDVPASDRAANRRAQPRLSQQLGAATASADPQPVYPLARSAMPRRWTSRRSPRPQWTIEASVKPARLRPRLPDLRRPRRESIQESRKHRAVPARLAFQITAEDRFAIRFHDVDDRLHEAVAADLAVEENHWYHTAATSDGRALRLYVDALDGRGYQLRGCHGLAADRFHGAGQGQRRLRVEYRPRPTGRDGRPNGSKACIDEVRVSDVALAPSQFLFTAGCAKAAPRPEKRGSGNKSP